MTQRRDDDIERWKRDERRETITFSTVYSLNKHPTRNLKGMCSKRNRNRNAKKYKEPAEAFLILIGAKLLLTSKITYSSHQKKKKKKANVQIATTKVKTVVDGGHVEVKGVQGESDAASGRYCISFLFEF